MSYNPPIYPVLRAFGVDPKLGKLPNNEQVIYGPNGIFLLPPNGKDDRGKTKRQHRLMIQCPHCTKIVSCGRYGQHRKVHENR
jgi:hypothetical protein